MEDYALLGDLQTAALVTISGSIDWLCFPRFDSPACFAALSDTPDAGHWQIAPDAGGQCTSRQYIQDTLVLQRTWVTAEGSVRVTDFMPLRNHTRRRSVEQQAEQGGHHVLLVCRNPKTHAYAFYRAWSPAPVPVSDRVKVAGCR